MVAKALDEEAIFKVAVAILQGDARQAYLEQVCGGDEALRGRVERLLTAHYEAPHFLESSATSSAATRELPGVAEQAGARIGPYKLVEQIGEGGMGVVYMAHQQEPVRRQVALKIIKPGMDSREVLARFQAEEQALALMDHPNIAQVYDAGTAESGRPYFVMEMVEGVPITQYCDDQNFTTRQRLELFVHVCQAVQHAHQKGVIHRDIKPSNILVTLHDGAAVPKIIDFGVAKATNQELVTQSLATSLGQLIGTPLYMSPEQAERSGRDIDTRSDIYSLGVVLYELLTGCTPFTREQLKDAGLEEIRRLIREQEPPRPSARISTLGEAATTVSAHRQTEPKALSHTLRQELDWIVLKALEKDRTRRYETASALARDIDRYLHDEPVEACPPSTVYRLRKFTCRHQAAVIATTAVSLALILGAGVAAGQAYRATKAEKYAEEQLQIAQEQQRLTKQQAQLAQKQKQLAEEAAEREEKLRVEAEQQRDLAQQATEQAEAARKQSEAVTQFLVDIFRSPDPKRDGRTITVAEMLDKAKMRVETEFKEDKRLQAILLTAIGQTYYSLGLWEESIEPLANASDTLSRVLGPEHLITLESTKSLAVAYWRIGNLGQSIPLFEKIRGLQETTLRADHPDRLINMGNLAQNYASAGRLEEAVPLLEKTFALCQEHLGLGHDTTLTTMTNLALAYRRVGRWKEALPLLERALELRRTNLSPDHPSTLATMCNLAHSYFDAGRIEEAMTLLEQTVELQKAKLGPDHPHTLTSMQGLALACFRVGRVSDAISLHERTLELQQAKLGPDDPSTLTTMCNLAMVYFEAGRQEEALPLLERTLELIRAKPDPDDALMFSIMNNLAAAYQMTGQLKEALPLYEQTAELMKTKFGPDHPDTLTTMNNLGTAYREAGRREESLSLLQRTLELEKTKLGPEHPDTLAGMLDLARIYLDAERPADALPLLEQTVELEKSKRGPDHSTTLASMSNLAQAYRDSGQIDRAVELLERTLQRQREVEGPRHKSTLFSLHHLAIAHARAGRLDQAAVLLSETLAGRRVVLGSDHPDTLDSLIELGAIHLQRNAYTEAEPLLLEAQQACVHRHETSGMPRDRRQLVAAVTQLIRLYENTNRPDQAVVSQKELDALRAAESK